MNAQLAQLIKAANCSKVEVGDDEFGEPDEFAKDSDLTIGSEPKLYLFGQAMLPENVTEQMEKEGYRPGTIADMLTFAINRNEWLIAELNEKRNQVVALGSISPVGGGSGTVTTLCTLFGKLYLGTTGYGGHSQICTKHCAGTLFIAVRK